MKQNIFVVIPNWNGADLIAECLASLQNQTEQAEIVVVDNGSHDDSVLIVEEDFPDVTLIKLSKNRGFAGGVNEGIKYAIDQNADAIALLNNDAVADKDWVKNLKKTMIDNSAGITTGKLMRNDKRHIDSTGDYYSVYGVGFPRGRNQIDSKQYEKAEEVFGASGGASLYSVEMLKHIGLFDEKFFAYFEDVDISFRARLAGWKIFYEPKAIAYHHVGATSGKLGNFTRYHSIKNFLILYTKNMPVQLYFKYIPRFIYQFARTTARSIIDFKLHVWAHAVLSFILYLPGILVDRIEIQKNRKISVKEADSLLYKKRPPVIPELP